MSSQHTKFYRDKQNGKVMGVSAGMADYTGIDVTLVRIGWVFMTFVTGGTTIPLYIIMGLIAPKKPIGLYADDAEQKFWQGVRQSPARVTRDVKGRFREIDRRLAEIETHYTSHNRRLSDEIESLR